MLEHILKALSSLPGELATFILAMMPVSELRGAIPFGLYNGIDLGKVLMLSIIGNLIGFRKG